MPELKNFIMPFGQHKGEKMENVPASYLLHFYDDPDKQLYGNVLKYVEENLDVLRKEAQDEDDFEGVEL